MNNIIVPTDFSEASINAAKFAAKLSTLIADAHLILYNVIDAYEIGDGGTPLQSDHEGRKRLMELALKSIENEITGITGASISLVVEESNHFVSALDKYVKQNDVQLIVMGITGSTRLSQVLMGSNTLRLIDRQTVPVMIVPPDAVFTDIKNVMLISDFKEVEKTIPLAPLKKILGLFQSELHIVNIDPEHYIELTEEYKAERDKLENMLKEFSPKFYFLRLYDFMDTINKFVEDYQIGLMISIPKNHSFLSKIFKTTHTTKLAYHSHIPIIAIHG